MRNERFQKVKEFKDFKDVIKELNSFKVFSRQYRGIYKPEEYEPFKAIVIHYNTIHRIFCDCGSIHSLELDSYGYSINSCPSCGLVGDSNVIHLFSEDEYGGFFGKRKDDFYYLKDNKDYYTVTVRNYGYNISSDEEVIEVFYTEKPIMDIGHSVYNEYGGNSITADKLLKLFKGTDMEEDMKTILDLTYFSVPSKSFNAYMALYIQNNNFDIKSIQENPFKSCLLNLDMVDSIKYIQSNNNLDNLEDRFSHRLLDKEKSFVIEHIQDRYSNEILLRSKDVKEFIIEKIAKIESISEEDRIYLSTEAKDARSYNTLVDRFVELTDKYNRDMVKAFLDEYIVNHGDTDFYYSFIIRVDELTKMGITPNEVTMLNNYFYRNKNMNNMLTNKIPEDKVRVVNQLMDINPLLALEYSSNRRQLTKAQLKELEKLNLI